MPTGQPFTRLCQQLARPVGSGRADLHLFRSKDIEELRTFVRSRPRTVILCTHRHSLRGLKQLLPPEVSGNDLLLNLCRRLVAADSARRVPSAQAADLGRKGAADFHRQLVKGDLASEYQNDIRVWLEALG